MHSIEQHRETLALMKQGLRQVKESQDRKVLAQVASACAAMSAISPDLAYDSPETVASYRLWDDAVARFWQHVAWSEEAGFKGETLGDIALTWT
jgi:hypothetical protein